MTLLADTSLFIDLDRDLHGARTWLADQANLDLVASVATFAELRAGTEDSRRVDAIVAGIELLPADLHVARIWGAQARYLRRAGMSIGKNDLWIAATALAYGLPVLTRNAGEFQRVVGLTVLTY